MNKYIISKFNNYFLTAQYPFSILYLPTQIQMDIIYRKTGFKREFSRFQMYKNKYSHWICWFFIRWNAHLFPQGFFIYFFFEIWWILNGFIEKIQGKISSFLTGMAFPHPFVWRNDISTMELSFLHTKGCVNAPINKFVSREKNIYI